MCVSLEERIDKIMYKWMYSRIVTEHSKKSKEELIQEIMALEKIECSDRCFANQCEAGNAISNINRLFVALNDMPEISNYVRNIIIDAEISWEYITNGINKINDNSRCENALTEFKNRVAEATDDDDCI